MEKNVTITISLEQAKILNALLFANVISFAQECDLEEASRLSKIGLIVAKAVNKANGESENEENNEE